MRLLAIAAIVLGAGAATQVAAQSYLADTTRSDLQAAAFAPQRWEADPIGQVLDRSAFEPGAGPVRWRTDTVRLNPAKAGGAVDTLRVSVGGVMRTPGGLPLNHDRAEFEEDAYEVAVTRDWPSAFRLSGDRFDLDVSPHAGFGMGDAGGLAEAGATVRVGKNLDDKVADRLGDIGVRDGSSFGDQGRWYLFAATSGRAVGLNMLRNEGGWDRAGWSTDPASALISDAQVGVAWRKGAMQTSVGYVRREIKSEHRLMGQETRPDSTFAISFSIKPKR